MNFYTIAGIVTLVVTLLFCGCTTSSPDVQTLTPVATTEMTLVPTPSLMPFPNALALNEYANFGSGDQQGQATVYNFAVKPNYNWNSPSWKSLGEQVTASQPLALQRGYIKETPKEGNTFLFVFFRVVNTGNKAVYAPSPQQFVVSINGTIFNYSSVNGNDVIIDNVPETQYDYQIGRGGTGGNVLPGESNKAEGYLIYEVPASFLPQTTYVVSNLDYQNQAIWKLE